jgi:4'-phosphopantetheinyl transferase EntD
MDIMERSPAVESAQMPAMDPLGHSFAEVQSLRLTLPGLGTRRLSMSTIQDFPLEVLESSSRRKALAFLVLSPPEREEWMGLKGTVPRQIQWLLGRAAAKHALRSHFHETTGRRFAAADLMIGSDAAGRPVLSGAWRAEVPGPAEVSISHTGGLVVAVAAAGGAGARVGVDAEKIRIPSQDLLEAAFSPGDLAHLPPRARCSEAGRAEWVFRLWCAKEAVGKALGTGVPLDPWQLEVISADGRTGMVGVRPAGGPEGMAATVRRGAHVLAIAVSAVAGRSAA